MPNHCWNCSLTDKTVRLAATLCVENSVCQWQCQLQTTSTTASHYLKPTPSNARVHVIEFSLIPIAGEKTRSQRRRCVCGLMWPPVTRWCVRPERHNQLCHGMCCALRRVSCQRYGLQVWGGQNNSLPKPVDTCLRHKSCGAIHLCNKHSTVQSIKFAAFMKVVSEPAEGLTWWYPDIDFDVQHPSGNTPLPGKQQCICLYLIVLTKDPAPVTECPQCESVHIPTLE